MKTKRKEKGKHTIHIRGLTDEQYENLWSIRYYINAHDWVDVIEWLLQKHEQELKLLKIHM